MVFVLVQVATQGLHVDDILTKHLKRVTFYDWRWKRFFQSRSCNFEIDVNKFDLKNESLCNLTTAEQFSAAIYSTFGRRPARKSYDSYDMFISRYFKSMSRLNDFGR